MQHSKRTHLFDGINLLWFNISMNANLANINRISLRKFDLLKEGIIDEIHANLLPVILPFADVFRV